MTLPLFVGKRLVFGQANFVKTAVVRTVKTRVRRWKCLKQKQQTMDGFICLFVCLFMESDDGCCLEVKL